jgi:hypothetical protein
LGIDAVQWRALVRTYLRLEMRGAGGAVRRDRARTSVSPLAGLVFVSGIGSVAFAVVIANASNTLLAVSLLTTYAAANTMMLLLVDFTGTILSPDDYGILGPRPVESRTYFAARFAAVTVYVGVVSVTIAVLPAIVLAVRAGLLAGVATVAAVLLCDLCGAVLVINGYVLLLRWIHPSRLQRATSYLQLVGATSFYLLYYFMTRTFQGAMLDRLDFAASPWLWSFPTTWFAAWVVVAEGATAAAWLAAGAACVVVIACLPLAAGRLSLDYARRLGELTAEGEAARAPRSGWLPGFRRGEARAVALLVRAQFRFDQRFRMGVLGILPLTGFYLLLGLDGGALQDPFVSGTAASGPGVFMAVVFIPMTLHAALTASESWRAAWIFFASPASHARIVVAAKNFVAMYFVGAYVLVLGALWSYFFERIWHAAVHALIAGLLAHLLLQLHVIVKPALPFAAEPRKAERSATLFGIILLGSIAAGVAPSVLSVVYRSMLATATVLALLVATTAGVEYALRLRVDEAIGVLEFRN